MGGDWARLRALTKKSRLLDSTVSRVRGGGRFVTSHWRRLTGRMAKVRVGTYEMRVPEDMLWAFSGGRYYEHNVIDWFERMLRIENDHVFYDIGANYGYYTLCAASVARQVYSFEPVSETRRQFRGNIDRNNLQDVVTVFPVGLSDAAGSVEVNLYSSSGNNSQYPRTSSDASLELVGSETIELAALDELVEAAQHAAADDREDGHRRRRALRTARRSPDAWRGVSRSSSSSSTRKASSTPATPARTSWRSWTVWATRCSGCSTTPTTRRCTRDHSSRGSGWRTSWPSPRACFRSSMSSSPRHRSPRPVGRPVLALGGSWTCRLRQVYRSPGTGSARQVGDERGGWSWSKQRLVVDAVQAGSSSLGS